MSSAVVTPDPTVLSPLAQLEAAIKTLLSSGPTPTIDLSQLGTQFPGLAPILKRLPGAPSSITGATLALDETAKTFTLAGTLAILTAPFSISAVCSIVGSKPKLVLTGTQGATPLTLLALAEHLGHHAPHTPDVSLTGLALALGTDSGDFTLSGTANWAIPFAATPSIAATATVTFTSKTAVITGTFPVGTATFQLTCDLAKNANSLAATWTNHSSPITWETVVSAAGVPLQDLPSSFAGPAFVSLELTLDFSSRSLTFFADTASAGAFLVVENSKAGWGFAIGVEQQKSFTLGSLSHNLKALDFVSFQDAFLLFSTYDDPAFVLPVDTSKVNCPPAAPAFRVYRGLNFGAQMDVAQGSGLISHLHALTGPISAVNISGALNLPDNVILTAALDPSANGKMTLPGTPVQITTPIFSVSLTGIILDANISMGIVIPIGQGQAPLVITGTLDLNETQASFTANAAADYTINAPFGLHGLVLQDIGVQFGVIFEPFGVKLGLEVGFALGGSLQPGQKLAFELAVTPTPPWIDPIYLYGRASQPITLPLLVNTVVPEITLPAFFNNFALSNLLLQYAQPPGQTLPDGTALAAGYAYSGTLDVFSFEMSTALSVTYSSGGPKGATGTSGVFGSFQMNPLTLPADAIAAAEQTGHAVAGIAGGATASQINRDLTHLGAVAHSLPTLVSITGVTTPGPYFSFSTATTSVAALAKSAATEVLHGTGTPTQTVRDGIFTGSGFIVPTGTTIALGGGPMVSGQAKIVILGAVGAEVFINLDARGFTFAIGVNAGSNVLSLSCTFYNKTLTAHCHLSFHINESFDLHVPGTNEYIGKISINANFDGALGLTVSEAGASLTVAGSFNGHTLPGGTFSVSSDALKDAATTVIARIRNEAEHVFKDITGDATKWANLVKNGAITGADSALHDANSAYGKAYKGLVQTEQQAQAAAAQAAKAAQDAANKAAKAAQDAANKAAQATRDAANAAKNEAEKDANKVGNFFKGL